MANSILSSLLSSPTLSIVSSQTGLDAATNFNVVRVGFKFRARTMRHMREDGTTIVDARIVQPARVEIDVICATLDDLTQANAVLLDRTGVYKVTSKGIVLKNMMAEEEVIKQSSEMISASPVRLTMKQVLTQDNSAPPQVEQPADSSMLDRGIQVINSVTQTAGALASNLIQSAQQLGTTIAQETGL